MSGFRRSLFGYRRGEVDAEIAARDAAMAATERALATCRAKGEELERVSRRLSEEVVRRTSELRAAHEEIAELRASGDEGMRSIAALGRQLEEIRTQARGQATQIRLKALKDASELVERVSDVAKLPRAVRSARNGDGGDAEEPGGGAERGDVFTGRVHMDVGPLSDFSQLVALEDAAGSIGAASEIKIRRFSQGRAELDMRLSEPVELLRELEQRCDLEFKVRSLKDGRVVLDVDDEE
ncbi:MAG TPA: hypothetical protein VK920_06865 [Solirubrobacterales bacterium]|nr:hypothetical protein [Solirubrobacterales bacterium]